jgi:hypothetical protein
MERRVRPLPRYVLAIMAAFVAFELWIPLLAIVIRALVGPTVPTAVQAIVPLFGLAVPTLVGLALSDYLADRRGLVRPYQPKRRASDLHQDDIGEEQEEGDEEWDELEEDEEQEREDLDAEAKRSETHENRTNRDQRERD